ncbi:MAG: TetR family transcriptional regulator [Casimicrobiaceae bacterium]
MTIRQRAVHAEDKHERHDAILDAAQRLLTRAPDRLASMADVADEAGLAKGTVYLYFASKEELLLALHERGIDAFFRGVIARAEDRKSIAVADVLALTREHMLAPPLFLPLATRCFAAMAQAVPSEAAQAFKSRMRARLARAGASLERHFPELGKGGGVGLLRHSYALVLGLWQLSAAPPPGDPDAFPTYPSGVDVAFGVDLERALCVLWSGTIASRDTQSRS